MGQRSGEAHLMDERIRFKIDTRQWEFRLVVSSIKKIVPPSCIGTLRVLEFGCGVSAGASSLLELGDLTVSDLYRDPLLQLPTPVRFVQQDIHHTSFADGEFDLVVSNQVLEYLDPERAFTELKRITKPAGYFVFAVPTATWLALTVPGQIVMKLDNVCRRFYTKPEIGSSAVNLAELTRRPNNGEPKKRWLAKFALAGHGRFTGFLDCWNYFRVSNWRTMLQSNGFLIAVEEPLLAYGSSWLPLFPTSRVVARLGFSASYLFICKNKHD
jgi:SAM-dependent methyltransferase